MPRPALILDLDGTVALGDGPVLAYAAAVARSAGLGDDLVRWSAKLLRQLPGPSGPPGGGMLPRPLDAYDLVRALALGAGAGPDALDDGYRDSRMLLGTAAAPVHAPAGLAAFLDGPAGEGRVERILVTNAPGTRLAETLHGLGLAGSFDRVVSSGGKPAGLALILDDLLADGPRPVLCAGDVWVNDLAPARERGLATALVGPWGPPEAPATVRGPDLGALLPWLHSWLDRALRPAGTGA